MNKNFFSLVLVLLIVLCVSFVSAVVDYCGGDVACQCGYSLNESRTFNESDNLTDCTGSGVNGLNIGVSNITLDCAGYPIASDGNNYGILLDGYSGVTIKNCDVSYFQTGIRVLNSADITLQNNTLTYNGVLVRDLSGIHMDNVANSVIIGNNVSNNDYGLVILSSENISIKNNTFDSNKYDGIYINGIIEVSDHIIQDNNITNNCYDYSGNTCGGIYLYNEDNCVIQRNNISGNYYYGILIRTSNNNRILSNNISDNSVGGIVISSNNGELGGYNNLTGNTLVDNDIGIGINTKGNRVIQNTISDSEGSKGIYLRVNGKGENNYLNGNDVSEYVYGLYADSVQNFTVDEDNYHDNAYGIYLSGAGGSEIMPTIKNSEIYNNTDGIWLSLSYANIENTNFADNNLDDSGLHVDSSSHVNLLNGNFENNGNYGIYDELLSSGSVDWTITNDVRCTNNDIWISAGWITIMGGSITANNCIITVESVELNTTAHEQGFVNLFVDTGSENPDTVGGSNQGVELEVTTNTSYTDNVTVITYNHNPGGSGFSMTGLGKWVKIENQSEINLSSAIIKVYYSHSELDAAGITESTLRLEYWNETIETWTVYNAPNGGVNMTEDYVWANTTHFSIWGLFGSKLSSGGGGGGSAIPTYNIALTTLDTLYNRLVDGSRFNFYFDGAQHSLIIRRVGAKVTFVLNSEPVYFDLAIGESKVIDLDPNVSEQLYIKVDSISNMKANIILKKIGNVQTTVLPITEKAPESITQQETIIEKITPTEKSITQPTPTDENGSMLGWLIAGIVLVAALLAFSIFGKAKNKK